MDLERNLAEMAQGVLVSQRHARLEQLERWKIAKKIVSRYVPMTDRLQVWLPGPQHIGTLLAECENNKDYPTEAFVAQVALGIQALSNFDGVKEPAEQREKSEAAKRVINWRLEEKKYDWNPA